MRALIIVAAMAWAMPAAAQLGNPGFVMPGTPQNAPGVPAPNHANTQDRLFAILLAAGGAAEVDFGRLAEGKAQNEAVKQFARRMVQDHTKANGELSSLANAAQIPLPGELDPDQKDMRAKLESLTGAVFDLYVHAGSGHRPSEDRHPFTVGDWSGSGRPNAAMGVRDVACCAWPSRNGQESFGGTRRANAASVIGSY